MASSLLLRAIYASLLGQVSVGPGNSTVRPSPDSNTNTNTFVITSTIDGDLRGLRRPTATTNVLVDSYLGIPFALPPVGQRRFGKPEPPAKWNGVRDHTQFGDECHQRPSDDYSFHVAEKPLRQSEDCLHLNVYAPSATSDVTISGPLAVMVFIHGGSFYLGAGSHYDGSELAASGVIVVTVNYRLDVFGFLSSEDDVLPGNYGMLDQIMALKWVQKNIASFGGDPRRVTVFGESSGSTSVSLLVLSPLTKGLFSRAIMESGVSLASWSIASPVGKISPRTLFSMISSKTGCTAFNTTKKLECLRSTDAGALLNASVSVENVFYSDLYAPRVETTFSFLPDFPITLLSQGRFNHVDTIHGFNTDETGMWNPDLENDGASRGEFVKALESYLQPYVITNRDQFINDTIYAYIGNQTDRNVIRLAIVKAISDLDFIGPTIIETNIQSNIAKEKKHYLYEFQYRPSLSTAPSWLKATHMDELQYVFGVNNAEFRRYDGGKVPTKDDILVWNQMKTLWSNFAKYGNPTQTVPTGAVKWSPYREGNNERKYLKIDVTSQLLTHSDTKGTVISDKLLQDVQTSYSFHSIIGRK